MSKNCKVVFIRSDEAEALYHPVPQGGKPRIRSIRLAHLCDLFKGRQRMGCLLAADDNKLPQFEGVVSATLKNNFKALRGIPSRRELGESH